MTDVISYPNATQQFFIIATCRMWWTAIASRSWDTAHERAFSNRFSPTFTQILGIRFFFSFFFALSRLNLIPDPAEAASGPTTPDYLDIHRNELPGDIYPLRISLPSSAQRKDTSIQTQLHDRNNGYITKEVRGGSECYAVVYLNDKIVVPRIPRGRSDALGHPLHRSDKSIHRLGRR